MPHTVAVVGLGYVGLPLAAAFGRVCRAIGYDINRAKVASCRAGIDPAGQVDAEELRRASQLEFSDSPEVLPEADFILVTVPTPVGDANVPDLGPLIRASEMVGRHMRRGATVVFESTVYPGATEEVCVPALERSSGMRWQRDFSVAYSPERINPGDREHTLARVVKVVAGDSADTLARTASLYRQVVDAGIHEVSSIRAAEAAKVIENTQRDLNIALMNELAIICNLMELDTIEVLEAAGTKWNFLPFRPGLVGGHCIGVDPYYLTHKAVMLGYHPQVILAGRRINDDMGKYVAEQTVKQMIRSGSPIRGSTVLVLGVTFKEDCPDVRNSLVAEVVAEIESFGAEVHVCDPVANAVEARSEYGIDLVQWDELPTADAVVVAVAHREFRGLTAQRLGEKVRQSACVIDVKSCLDAAALRAAGYHVWRL